MAASSGLMACKLSASAPPASLALWQSAISASLPSHSPKPSRIAAPSGLKCSSIKSASGVAAIASFPAWLSSRTSRATGLGDGARLRIGGVGRIFGRLAGHGLWRVLTEVNGRVLRYFFGKLDSENFIHLPQTEIAEALGLQKSHVSRAVKLLCDKRIIIKGPKTGRAITYRRVRFKVMRPLQNPDYAACFSTPCQ